MIFPVVSVILTVASIILMAFNIIREKYYPYVIYIVALFAVYSTTMLGVGVVGSDISAEVFRSREAFNFGWNFTMSAPEVTSFVVGWLVPLLSRVLFIEVVWVYKIILPMIFALCPVILYFVYAKQIDKPKAFLSSMFFVIMPVFSLEISTIGKSMVAEVFLAVAIYALIADWKKIVKFLVILASLWLALWAHYTIGLLSLIIFFIIGCVMIVAPLLKKWKLWQIRNTPWWLILAAVLLIAVLGWAYLDVAGGGVMTRSIRLIWASYWDVLMRIFSGRFTIEGEQVGPVVAHSISLNDTYLNKMPFLIRTSTGFDFNETTISGRVFRIIQFITQFLIIIGCIGILFRYKNYKLRAEFLASMCAGVFLLAMCIFFPYFSSSINVTRLYHISLFFIAPTLVIGVDFLVSFFVKNRAEVDNQSR